MLHVYLKQIDVLIKNFNNDCPERSINSQTLGYGDAPNGDFLLPGTDTAPQIRVWLVEDAVHCTGTMAIGAIQLLL